MAEIINKYMKPFTKHSKEVGDFSSDVSKANRHKFARCKKEARRERRKADKEKLQWEWRDVLN